MNTEKRVKALENALKALKASCPVVASKVKTYLTQSQVFTSTGSETVRIRFTPTYNPSGATIATLYPKVMIGDSPVGFESFVNEPQTGDGTVVIKVQFEQYSASTTYQIRVFAFGTSSGTFDML